MLGNDWVAYRGLVERAENAMRSWDAIMTTAAQTFSALANVAARHEVDNQHASAGGGNSAQEEAAEQKLAKHSRPRARAVENAGKMEAYCVGLTRVVASLRDIVNTLVTVSTDATTTYAMAAAHITRSAADASSGREQVRTEAVQRGARAASVLDVVEALQAVAAAYEREYWVKQRIVGCALDVCRPQDMDVLLQAWAEDTQIAREELRALLRRAKGCEASLSVD